MVVGVEETLLVGVRESARLSGALREPVKELECFGEGEGVKVELEDADEERESLRVRVPLPDTLGDAEEERVAQPVRVADGDPHAVPLREAEADAEAQRLREPEREGDAVEDTVLVGAWPVGLSDPHAVGVGVPGSPVTEEEGRSVGDTVSRAVTLGERESRKPVCEPQKVAEAVGTFDGVFSMVVGMGVTVFDSDEHRDTEPEMERVRDIMEEMERLAVMNPVRERVARPTDAVGGAVVVPDRVPEGHMEREGAAERLREGEEDGEGDGEGEGLARVLTLSDGAAVVESVGEVLAV